MQNPDHLFDYSESEIDPITRQSEILRPITQRLLTSSGRAKRHACARHRLWRRRRDDRGG